MTVTEGDLPPLARRTPLGPMAGELASSCSGPRFRAVEDGFRTLTDVRCAPAGEAAFSSLVGGVPALNRAVAREGTWVVSLGPAWWLVDGPAGAVAPPRAADVSAVDVSAQRTAVDLTGPAARDVVAHGCSLDLHPEAFRIGHAAQTMLAKAGVILVRAGADHYRLWVRASFARYLAAWLVDASTEYR